MQKSKGKLYAGSRQRNQFVVIHTEKEEDDQEEKKEHVELQNSESDEGLICRICEEDVDRTSEGEIFVACNECAFPVCRACYDYERIEGNTTCPQCRTRYKRLKGSARVEGDEEETEVDDINSEFNLLPRVEHPPSSIASNFSDGSPDLRLVPYYEGSDVPSECHTYMSSQADDERQLAIVASYGHGTVVWKGETDEDWKNKQIVLHMERIEEEKEENRVEHHNESRKVMGDGGNQQPLSRKMPIGSSMINPYRIVIVLRLVVLGFFFHYRILNPVPHAYGLWLTSVICEIWFAISWILDQFPKWYPIERETYLDRLTLRYDKEGQPSELAGIDVFVSTVDPLKEPPLITANTVLSILAVDYPVDKVSCYVSDDGGSMLTFQALSDAFAFAKKWVPFCKKFNIEPRAPEWYFAQKVDYLKDKTHPSFVRERRMMKREYEKFKIHINHLVEENEKAHEKEWILPDGFPWPAQNSRDHPSLIQSFVEEEGQYFYEEDRIPKLFYVSREKRPGFDHHKKAGAMNALVRVSAVISNAPYILNVDCDHYINNSKALREAMCFMMDPDTGKKICYVQFPQRFDGIDKNDRYSNRNVVFFDINMKGLDGIQGPIYVGTGCVFRREALYGYDAPGKKTPRKTCNCWLKLCCLCCNKRRKAMKAKKKHKHTTKQKDALKTNAYYGVHSDIEALIPQEKPEKKFGHSTAFLASLQEKEEFPGSHGLSSRLSEAMHVVGCGYEDKTEWGKEVGWIYGSVTEDILTGFKMHCHGWRSVYCIPKRAAFKGSAPINLSDRLHQVLRWALGSVEILLSRHCPIWYGYGSGLKRLERFSYVNSVVYPLTSIPLIIYCTLPAICLLTGDFIVPEIGVYAAILFLSLFVSIAATSTLEIYWGGISLDDLWRNEQFWVIGGVSSHFFAIFQGLLKVIGGVETSFTVTSKGGDDGAFSELYALKWTTLLIPPTTLLVLNIIGVFAGIADAVNNGYKSWILLFGKFLFALWVIIHLYPFLKGMMGKQNKVPTVVWVWSTILAIVSSLLWARVDPFGGGGNSDGPILEVCGLQCT